MKNKKISIIIPCYNMKKFLPVFFNNLIKVNQLNQAEIIFINDASTDNTKQIIENKIKKYNNITLINHSSNKGLGGAINTGISIMKTNWMFKIDPDDIVNYNYIDEILKKINDKTMLIRFKFNYFKNKTITKVPLISSFYFKMAFGWSMGININLFGKPKFKENFKMEDMEMFGRQYKPNGKEVFINKSLINYTIDNMSSITKNINKKTLSDWKKAFSIYSNNKFIKGVRTTLYKKNIKWKIKHYEKNIK